MFRSDTFEVCQCCNRSWPTACLLTARTFNPIRAQLDSVRRKTTTPPPTNRKKTFMCACLIHLPTAVKIPQRRADVENSSKHSAKRSARGICTLTQASVLKPGGNRLVKIAAVLLFSVAALAQDTINLFEVEGKDLLQQIYVDPSVFGRFSGSSIPPR